MDFMSLFYCCFAEDADEVDVFPVDGGLESPSEEY